MDKVLAGRTAVVTGAASGIGNVNCVCPGPTDTPLYQTVPEKLRDAFVKAIPFRRVGKPDEVADAVLFFAGPQSGQEWSMGIDDATEAEAQAICMQTKDYGRAYRAFVAKQKPVFEGD